MGLIKEPKNVDFTVQSKHWTEEELKDFRKVMKAQKSKQKKEKIRSKKSTISMDEITKEVKAVRTKRYGK